MIRRFAPPVIYLTALVLMGFAIFGTHGAVNLMTLNRETDRLQRKADSLAVEVSRAEEELEKIRHDPSALERRARRELGLSRSDEILYVQKNLPKKGPF